MAKSLCKGEENRVDKSKSRGHVIGMGKAETALAKGKKGRRMTERKSDDSQCPPVMKGALNSIN